MEILRPGEESSGIKKQIPESGRAHSFKELEQQVCFVGCVLTIKINTMHTCILFIFLILFDT